MKKVSLLAASVAIALTGCGGGGSDSNTDGNTGPVTPPPSGGVIITGFDGYFKNAVMFVDQNNNGVWDANENILGLTNEKGQVELTEKPTGTLALQTITPNGAAQAQLIGMGDKYAGVYTVDMDHPAQAMAHELVFRAPNNSDVISPITDLVAIEMKAGKTAEEAEAAVNEALGGTTEAPIDLYSDFVTGNDANAELHKTAQILTESKAKNPTSYEKKATEFAEKADAIVNEMVENGEDIKDVNNKPVIEDTTPDSDNLVPEVITNSKLIVDATVKDAVVAALPKLKEDDNFTGAEIAIAGLFVDADQKAGVIPSIKNNLDGTGITASIVGDKLVLSPAHPVMKPGSYTITLTATDLDSKAAELATISTELTLNIEALNQAPVVVDAEKTALQSEVDAWYLQAGEAFEQTLNISTLFNDNDGSITKLLAGNISVAGLTATTNGNGIVTITGTPSQQYVAGQTFSVTAQDDDGSQTSVTFTLPEVKEGVVVPPPADKNPLEGKTWYALEYGSDDGSDSNGPQRIWCDSYRFENGIIYTNIRNPENTNTCSAADTPSDTDNYVIDGNNLIATYSFVEDGVSQDEIFTYSIADHLIGVDSPSITAVESDGNGERYTWFSNKGDVEKRLNVKSDAGFEGRDFKLAVPASQEEKHVLGSTSLQIKDTVAGDGQSQVSVWIDTHESETFSCTDLQEFYSQFQVTSENMTYSTGTYACQEADNAPQGVVMNINLNEDLVEGQKYSVIAAAKNKFMESIKFNMMWTGTSNDE
ncbi:Ig-like domain-containing protein [Photobacterium nomapromontoriensis]|uniref:Ig-like domain-containing protein n=1 Tax=Photobacterium nomapromontoriensis TaxID=2910237 RepID=UPI003D124C81